MTEHRCNINEYCFLNDTYKIWFCYQCRKATYVEYDNEVFPLMVRETDYKQNEISEEKRQEYI